MHTIISILTLLPIAGATLIGTCKPTATRKPDFDSMTYPTILTDVYSCTQNLSITTPPFDLWEVYSNHEQTLTTLQPFSSKPTLFPYTHVITVQGVLRRTEWVGHGVGITQTTTSTVTDVETMTIETDRVATVEVMAR